MEHQAAVKTNQPEVQSQASCCGKGASNPPDSIHLFRELQHQIGNRALGRHIQAKLNISEPGDTFEREADRVADEVIRMAEPAAVNEATPARQRVPHIQRMCAECDEEQPMRKTADEQQEKTRQPIQMKEVSGGTPKANSLVQPSIDGMTGGQSLSASTRAFFEPRFGQNFSEVQVHNNSSASNSARALNALAFTAGRDIVFGAGQYAPETTEGRRLLAHELTHVVQQGIASSASLANGASITKSAAQVQRVRLPCTTRTKVDVYSVDLPGSTRSIGDDLTTANDMLCQCGIELNVVGGESWDTNLLDQDAPSGVLNAPAGTVRALTAEETSLLAYKPGGPDVVHVYYVPSFTGPKLAEAFWPAQHGETGVVVANAAIPVVMPHELGHVLLNDGSHHSNRDNLMAAGTANSGAGELEQTQCNLMP